MTGPLPGLPSLDPETKVLVSVLGEHIKVLKSNGIITVTIYECMNHDDGLDAISWASRLWLQFYTLSIFGNVFIFDTQS